MKKGNLLWFTQEDYDVAIKWRKDSIEQSRIELNKLKVVISKLEGEIYFIEECRAKNLDGVDDIPQPILQGEKTAVKAKVDYNPKWSWYEKAHFVLSSTKQFGTARDIVFYLTSVEPEWRGKQKKIREAQAAIINSLKPRIESGIIATISDPINGMKYGLKEWGNDAIS